jgi:hypothetical protein
VSRWWLVIVLVACGSSSPKPPPKPVEKPAPSCVAAADHMLDLVEPKDQHARKIRDIFQRRCEVDAWPGDVRECIVSTTSLKDPKGCKSRLVIMHREALERDLAEADREARTKALPECERYKQRIEQLLACDRLPQQSRDALKQGYDSMAAGWAEMKDMPEEAQKALQDGCKHGADALEQAVKDLCGW